MKKFSNKVRSNSTAKTMHNGLASYVGLSKNIDVVPYSIAYLKKEGKILIQT